MNTRKPFNRNAFEIAAIVRENLKLCKLQRMVGLGIASGHVFKRHPTGEDIVLVHPEPRLLFCGETPCYPSQMKTVAAISESAGRLRLWSSFFWAALFLVVSIFSTLPAIAQDAAGKRVALVIGNGAYEHVPALKNPANDATDLATTLGELGFEVTLHTDKAQSGMLDVLREFRLTADAAEIALVYFAGHGIEIDRQNYLLPIDAQLQNDTDVNFEAITLETLMFAASGAERLSMIIVDACRDNPFKTTMKRSNASRSIGQGLAAVEPSRNTLVAYAAKEGTTAADGIGRNSPYASALISALQEPRIEVGLMMRRVRDDVLNATAGRQEPFVYGSLSADEIFLNDPDKRAPSEPEFVVTDGDVEDVPLASVAEIVLWKSIKEDAPVADVKAYLELYPNGFFADLARTRIAKAGGAARRVASTPKTDNSPEKVSTLARVLNRDELIEVQERLSVLGHSLGPADGIIGKRTEAAIRQYEKSKDLPLSGQASVEVLTALRAQVGDAEVASWRAEQARKAKPTPKAKKALSKAKKTPARPKTTAKAATPKPKTTQKVVTKKVVTKPKAKTSQFWRGKSTVFKCDLPNWKQREGVAKDQRV